MEITYVITVDKLPSRDAIVRNAVPRSNFDSLSLRIGVSPIRTDVIYGASDRERALCAFLEMQANFMKSDRFGCIPHLYSFFVSLPHHPYVYRYCLRRNSDLIF